MKVNGKPCRTIWPMGDRAVGIIDQTRLPYAFETLCLENVEQAAHAIRSMQVRGAPLIGVAAAFGLSLGLQGDPGDAGLQRAYDLLLATRPTAVNLRWALDRVRATVQPKPPASRALVARLLAMEMAEEDVATCRKIGEHGYELLRQRWEARGRPERLNVLTHCNAGWLATVDWGTALAPIYVARERGLPIHVWVDETRPRNQGYLTAWELAQEGISHTIIVDNAGGHLLQHGQVDACIVGTDRTTARGDVCNKIGTYLKALAAQDNNVPFYVAAPSSSIDFNLEDGVREIPIEERSQDEVHRFASVRVTPEGSPVANPAFDVTPARLVSAIITEHGVFSANATSLVELHHRLT